MIEQSVSLASNGVVKVPGYEQLARFGYTKNRGVYRLAVTASGEWEGLTIRAFWHVPGGKDPASSLVTDGYVDVPASVTAQPGNGCITFEGSDGTKTVTSADLRYRVSANSGTEDGTEPEPGSPAWQQLVDAVHTDATAAEQAKTDARTAASEAATSAGNANQSAQEAADSLQALKDGIANGDFKGEKGDKGDTGPAVAVDPTLSIESKAADAKATGDAIGELKEDLAEQRKSIGFSAIRNLSPNLEDGTIKIDGTEGTSSDPGYRVRSIGYIEVDGGKSYTMYAPELRVGDFIAVYICSYRSDRSFIDRVLLDKGMSTSSNNIILTFSVTDETAYIRIYMQSNKRNSDGTYYPWRYDGSDLMLNEGEWPKPYTDDASVKSNVTRNPLSIFFGGALRESYSAYAGYTRNTVESVTVAKKIGYKYIKCDCRITADNEIVLCHDATLNESTDYTGSKTIREMTLSEVKYVSIRQTKYPYAVRVATLSEFLDACKRENMIPFVNLRNEYLDDVVPRVSTIIDNYGFHDTAIVQSTDSTGQSLRLFRKLNNDCACMIVLVADTSTHAPTIEHLKRAMMVGNCALCVHDSSKYISSDIYKSDFVIGSKTVIEEAHKHGIPVMYAISDDDRDALAFDAGYDGTMTNAIGIIPDSLMIRDDSGAIRKIKISNGSIVIS